MRPRRAHWAFVIGLAAGLSVETLLFLKEQCRSLEEALQQDFRVLLFPQPDLPEEKAKVLEERLWAVPDVQEVRWVSRHEALERLRGENPELLEAVTVLGENPLSSGFEVQPSPRALARAGDWLAQIEESGDWADIRYKPAQVRVFLQAQFYRHFITLSLSGLLCLGALAGAWGLWLAVGASKAWRAALLPIGLAAGGVLLGVGLTVALALPMRLLTPWAAAWPGWLSQLGLLIGACAAGWAICGTVD
ncbi:MAG: hypothetical protein HY549_12250 [Elusimicrobia bacterium]|nr:hypothetical protein [Elusimicrobiota bacterium]